MPYAGSTGSIKYSLPFHHQGYTPGEDKENSPKLFVTSIKAFEVVVY